MFISRWRIPWNESFRFGVRPFIIFLASSVDVRTDAYILVCRHFKSMWYHNWSSFSNLSFFTPQQPIWSMRVLSFEISAKYLKALLFEQGGASFRFRSRFIRGTKTQHPSVRRENLSTLFTKLTPVDVDKQWKIIRLLKTKKYNTHVLRHIFSIVFLSNGAPLVLKTTCRRHLRR